MDILEKNNQALAEIFSDALKKTREHTDQRLNEMANSINQIVEYIKQEQPAAAQQATQGNNLLAKYGIPEELVQNIVTQAFNNVFGTQQRQAEEDTLLELITRGKRRQLVASLTKEVGTLLKRGYVYDEEVEEALGAKLESTAAKVVGGDHNIA